MTPSRPIQLIYADPAWHFQTWGPTGGRKTSAGCRTTPWETLHAIGDLLRPHLDPRAYLVLWMPRSQIQRAIAMAAVWGFPRVVVGGLFTWVKQHPSGKFLFGCGHTTRGNPEQAWLFGRIPDGPAAEKVRAGLQSWGPERNRDYPRPAELLLAPPGKLWSKPPQVRRYIEQMWVAERRVELFARPHPDLDLTKWEAYGDEMDGRDILDALRDL